MISGTIETAETLNAILKTIDEGIHVVDSNGMTIFYNNKAESLDGLSLEEVQNYHVLDAFPSLTKETSTLLKVIQTGKPIYNQQQSYTNRKGMQVDTVNTTLPIWMNGELLGAVEVAKDISKIKQLSDKLIELQSRMNEKKPKSNTGSFASFQFDDILTNDPRTIELKHLCKKASGTSSPILIYGETGTGKEMFVQSIHNHSRRRKHPFIVQNCAAIPGPLLEGILFGTTKGSFTGAVERPGVFELADGGTLFLDEINSMPTELQAKLLRVIQEGTVQRIGSATTRKVDVRIISALNEKPEECLKNGHLRQDLFYRLNVVSIELSPLRERRNDILLLAVHFINRFNENFHKKVEGLTEEAQYTLLHYPWPGNVRELKHTIEHAMNFSDDSGLISYELFPKHIKIDESTELHDQIPEITGKIPPLKQALNDYEQAIIQKALQQTSGNIQQAAKLLQVPRQTLQYKLKQK